MKLATVLATVLLLIGLSQAPISAATTYAKASGNWNDVATWHANQVPDPGDNVFIGGGCTVTVTVNTSIANVTVGKACSPSGGNGTLVINSGVVLSVTGGVTLGDGSNNGTIRFQTAGSGELNLTNPAGSISFATGGSCFCGPSVIRRSISGAGTWVFSSPNTRIVTGAGQAAIDVLVKTWPNTHIPVGDASKSIKRYLSITPSGPLAGTFRFSYASPGELNGLTESNITAWYYNGTAWVNQGGIDVPANHYVEVTNISNCGIYWSAADPSTPLPVQVASFSGNVQSLTGGYSVTLDWMTVSETNSYGFYVERRASSETEFSVLQNSFVAGNGTTLEQHSYSFTDENIPAGDYDYRLEQVDLDGLESFSAPIRISVGKTTDVKDGVAPFVFKLNQNYPNPFNPSTRIVFTVAETNQTTLKVFNLLGEEMATLFSGNASAGKMYTVSFDATRFVSGVYFYRIQSGGFVEVHRMNLVK